MAHTSGNRPSVHDRDVAKYVREDDDLADNLVVPSLSTSEVLFEEAMVDGWVHHQSCSTPALQPASKASVHELLPHVDSAEGVADVAKPDRRESQAGLVKRMTVLYRNFKRSVDGDPTTAHFRPSVTTVVPNFVDGQATVTQLIPSIIPDTVPEPLSDFNDSCQPVLVDGEESDDEAKAQAELATMSKLQANLAVEEGRIWALVLHDVHVPEDGAVTKPTPEVPRIVEDDDRINKVTQRLYQLCAASDSLNQSYAKRNKTPTGRTYAEARTIMNAMGAAVIEAPYPFEAEGVAASLYAHGVADVVASEDTDVIVYDAPLLRNLTSRDHPLIYTSGREVREALSLSRSSFVDFALLLGSDFSQRLAGLGPSRAIKLIQAKGSIEAIIQSERAKEKGQKFLPEPKLTEEEYLKQVEAGRMVFQTLPPISEDIKMELMKPRSIDEASVAEILRAFDLGADFWHDGVSEHEDPLQVDYYDPALQGLHGDYIYA
ncbi:hypothetical protein FRB96_000283 [Tulasnella sp. 330]|nr:hypothetical protein FRB96_000283 [Tulasnella sp. 330]KAG8882261.1 hypothetical protein FRB97_008464 [Tulasnella sp. 331]KAG8886877.1 hypothetical protein FRB98_000903 [Tulasnella sp. 332]